MEARTDIGWGKAPLRWGIIAFFTATHLLAVAGIVHLITDFNWWTLGLGVVWYFLCGLSVTAGYHRLFSHRSYKANAFVRAFFLCFGSAACEDSVLKWSTDHRVHHRYSDQNYDPYSVSHGFWWAHIGWILHAAHPAPTVSTKDLEADPMVRFQHKWWGVLAIAFGAALPMAIGTLWGDPLGALLVAGFLRLVFTWHATFSVNSLTHRFGRQTYSKEESARDSWWVALLTLGEGYHNFHHRFQGDFRNGIRWFHFDPSKWVVWTLSRLRLANDLVKVPAKVIDQAREDALHGRKKLAPAIANSPEPATSAAADV